MFVEAQLEVVKDRGEKAILKVLAVVQIQDKEERWVITNSFILQQMLVEYL